MTITEQNSYVEDFTAYSSQATGQSTAGVLPTCWDTIYMGEEDYVRYAPHVYRGSYGPNGSNDPAICMTAGIDYWYGNSAYAILPPFTNDLTTLELSFRTAMLWGYADYCTLSVGYVTDATDAGTFVALTSVPNNAYQDGAADHTVPLDEYGAIPAGARLAFRWAGTSSNTVAIDDIVLRLIPNCLKPLSVMYGRPTDHSVELSWTSQNGETAWELEYGAVGFELGGGTILPVNTNPYVLAGLSAGTEYDVYVRALCAGDGMSESSGVLTIHTQCEASTITIQNSYVEDFTAYSSQATSQSTAGVLPTCWDAIYTGVPSYSEYAPHVYRGSYGPNGSNDPAICMTAGIDYWYGNSAYAILPPFTNDLTTLELSFRTAMLWGYADYCTLSVGYVTDATDAGTFVALTSVPNNAYQDGAADHTVPLDEYGAIPAGARLAFRWAGTSSNTVAIDDIVLRLIPNCLKPLSVMYGRPTDHSVELSWMSQNGETAWELEYGAVGFELGSGTILPVNTNPYVLAGLSAGTEYDVYVRALCAGDGMSESSDVLTIHTQCEASTITIQNSYVEDFAAYSSQATGQSTAGVLPTCWDTIYTGVPSYSEYAPHVYRGSYGPNGSNDPAICMTAGIDYWYGNSAYAILPPFTNDLTTLELSFRTAMLWGYADYCTLSVGYVTDATDAGTFVALTSVPNNAYQDGAADHTIPLDEYGAIPAGARLAFRWAGTSSNTVAIDDIVLRLIPECHPPVNVNVTQISDSSALVDWSSVNGENSWIIEYGASGFILGNGISVAATGHPFLLSNLADDTHYDVYVRAQCEEDIWSEWSEVVDFQTDTIYIEPDTIPDVLDSCATPTDVVVTPISATEVRVTWSSTGNETSWIIDYAPSGYVVGEGYEEVSLNTMYVLTVSPGIHYDVYVRAICGNELSDWSAPSTFITQPDGIGEFSSSAILVYPNPTVSSVRVEVKGIDVVACRVHELSGRCVKCMDVQDRNFVVDLSEFGTGIYFLQLLSDQGAEQIVKIVKNNR